MVKIINEKWNAFTAHGLNRGLWEQCANQNHFNVFDKLNDLTKEEIQIIEMVKTINEKSDVFYSPGFKPWLCLSCSNQS